MYKLIYKSKYKDINECKRVNCFFFFNIVANTIIKAITYTNQQLSLSWRRPLSYGNQSIDLRRKSMDWFLYDNGLRHERVKLISRRLQKYFKSLFATTVKPFWQHIFKISIWFPESFGTHHCLSLMIEKWNKSSR